MADTVDKKYTEKYYDRLAYGFKSTARLDHRRILELVDFEDKRVLDIGCGLGTLLKLIPSSVKNKSGIESNAFAVESCKKDGLNVIEHNDLEKLPFRQESFDVVIMNEVIEHLRNPEKVVKEVQRIIRSGGVLVLTTPNKTLLVRNTDPTHCSEMNFSELENLIRNGGFKITAHEVCGFGPYSFIGRKILFPLGRMLLRTSGNKASNQINGARNAVDSSRLFRFRTSNIWSADQQLIIATKS
ncbi:MAG: class I SAM-dependent methyltransferase [Patescibacteria group bacterium]|jgi:2-polyprenyl-3-methyl-5-hydroxy-6-metoxy-1,4-benzoquinol methylase